MGSVIALVLVLHGYASAQESDRARAFRTSLIATVVPVGAGVAVMAATGLEGDGAVAGYVLATVGASVGPALGYWQKGDEARGWAGAAGRLALTWGSLVLAAAELGDCDFWTCNFDNASLIVLAGHGLAVTWAVSDIAALGGVTIRWPRSGKPPVRLSAVVVPSGRAPGLLLGMRF